MIILAKYLPFVNEQIQFQERMCKKFFLEPNRVKLHLETKAKFQSLYDDISSVYDAATESNSFSPMLSEKEINSLPQEMRNELSFSEKKPEYIIFNIIKNNGGELNLDRLLIEYYNQTKEIIKRSSMISKLYKLSKEGMVKSVKSKKGWYTTNTG